MLVEVETPERLKFNKYFTWYKSHLENTILNATKNFLEKEFKFKLIAVSHQPNETTKNDSFFVTQVKLHEKISSSIKLSQGTIQVLLEQALGAKDEPFEIDNITELEAKVLTAFNHSLYQELSPLFTPKNKLRQLINDNELKADYIYFTLLISKNKQIGKIVLCFPVQLFNPPIPLELKEQNYPQEYFANVPVELNILVGSTQTLIEDVKKLQIEDLVILDNSDISKMQLIENFDFEIKLNPDPMLVYNYQENSEYEIEEEDMTNNKDKNRWDLIQVDMSAEFEKVKMPLGELRQISEGLIVDLADIYKNSITLKVEENAIAKGELVIVDDKYGVLIKEIYTDEEETSSENVDTSQEEPQQHSAETDDDFDLEDFDIDDDIDNLDDEDI